MSSVAPAVVRPPPPAAGFFFDEVEYSSLMRSLVVSTCSTCMNACSPLKVLFVQLEPLQTGLLFGSPGGLFRLGFLGVLPLNLGGYRQGGG